MTLISKNFSEVITFSRGTGATRVNSAGLIVGVDFSATSNTIATGSKTFTITADANVNRDWPVGSNVIAVSQAGATGSMTGVVTSYTPSTQALVINVTSVTGSGTSTNWRIGSLDVREDYDPVTLVRRGVLSEVAATNLLTFSEDIADASWVKETGGTGAVVPTVTSNAGLSLSGSNSADRVVFTNNGTATADFSRIRKTITNNPIGVSSFSFYARAFDGVGTYVMQMGGPDGFTTTITVTGEWKLFSITQIALSASVSYVFGLRGASGNSTTADVLFFGAQAELNTPTSYIPTTTTQVTRNADNFPLTAAAVASIRQGEGTLYAEIDCPDTGVAQKRALRLSGTNADIRIGKQGTGTLSNFTKMAEGAGLRLMGTANSLIRGNGQELLPVTANLSGTPRTLSGIFSIAFNGSTFGATDSATELELTDDTSTLIVRGFGLNANNGVHWTGSSFLGGTSTANRVLKSTNGTSYRVINTPVITQPTNEITSGLVGGTLRNVIVGSNGFIATSDDDGETWTSRTSSKNLALTGAAFGLNLFVVSVSESPTSTNIITSPDGITWTSRTTPVANYNDVAFNGSNLFVAVASNGIIISSPNGITWTERFTSAISFRGVHFADGLWVAVGDVGSVVTSPDGLTWTNRTATSGTTTSLQEVNFFNGNFYAVGNGSTLIRNTASAIVAGTAWVSLTAGVSGVLIGIAASPTTLLITGSAGTMASSTNGTNFTSRTNNSQTLNGIAFGNNVFVSVGNAANGSGYIATIGADGTVTRRVSGLTQSVTNARFLNNRFWFPHPHDGTNALRSTTDFSTISTHNIGVMNANDIAFDGASTFVVVGNATNNCSVSTNGASTFTAFRVGNIADILGVAFGAGLFVLVGTAGSIYSSPTGLNGSWTLRGSGTTQDLKSVMFSTRDQLWYAAGNGGTLLYSPDAITWTAVQNSGTASILGTTLQSNQPLPQFKSGVNKIALSYKQNQVIAALNGVTSTSDTAATIPTITAGAIGENINGYIKDFFIYKEAMTTAEIIARTL